MTAQAAQALADRLLGSAQALETAARRLKDRARQLRQHGTRPDYTCDDVGWGKSDIHTGYRAALSQLETEGGS